MGAIVERSSLEKIPNLKHQITNKSQISIFNDQNILCIFIAFFDAHCSASDEAMLITVVLFVWNFEFGLLEFVWNLVFGAWNFH